MCNEYSYYEFPNDSREILIGIRNGRYCGFDCNLGNKQNIRRGQFYFTTIKTNVQCGLELLHKGNQNNATFSTQFMHSYICKFNDLIRFFI